MHEFPFEDADVFAVLGKQGGGGGATASTADNEDDDFATGVKEKKEEKFEAEFSLDIPAVPPAGGATGSDADDGNFFTLQSSKFSIRHSSL